MEESKVNYGQEFGKNLIKVAKSLLKNQDLLKLLVNTDVDPLGKQHPDIENPMREIFGKQIRVVPLVQSVDEKTTSKIVIVYSGGTVYDENATIERASILVYIYCPFEEWLITGDNLRPHAIMAEIRKSLQNKRINGLGEIRYEGFDLSSLTKDVGSYTMRFTIGTFN